MAKFDQAFDPITLDYVDSDDGGWEENEDSRTAVRMILDIEFGKWWGNASDGSRITELMQSVRPTTVDELTTEVRRALQVLVDDGIITDLSVSTDKDEAERDVFLLVYRDLASGKAVDFSYSPFGD